MLNRTHKTDAADKILSFNKKENNETKFLKKNHENRNIKQHNKRVEENTG